MHSTVDKSIKLISSNHCLLKQSIDELKHALICTTLELESTQMAVEKEKRRNDENEEQFIQLLKAAYQERDEAKYQLQTLLNNSTQLTELTHVVPSLLTEPLQIMPAKRNSSITESDSLSETYHHRSRPSSSPVDSIFDPVASPELSNINLADHSNIVAPIQPFFHECKSSSYTGVSSGMAQMDLDSATIDRLAMKKPLPEKGKLFQAILDAGPLLQTLLIAGPLPQWRNPPPPHSSQVPPVLITGFDSAVPPYHRASNGASRLCSTSMLNFTSPVSPCVMKRPVLTYGVGDTIINDPIPMVKRQKFQC